MIPRTSLDQWAALAAVVDEGGFAQAGLALHRSQSAVSYNVQKLQESLGVPLLAIEGRRAVLTPHGRTLLDRARRLLADANTLECIAGSLKAGVEAELSLVIEAAFPQQRLLAILRELQASCPNTRLRLTESVLSGSEEPIVSGSADVVITTRVPPGFLGNLLFEVSLVAVAHRDHPLLALGRELSQDDLVPHTQAVLRDSGTQAPRDEGWLGARVRWTMSSVEASLAAVRDGLAFAWLPDHLVEADLASGVLKRLPLVAGARRLLPLYAVLVKPETAGPAARMAIELFERHIPANPS
jgi:DNA-binding transcriptional LysR family regulator